MAVRKVAQWVVRWVVWKDVQMAEWMAGWKAVRLAGKMVDWMALL
jgi:hypothetical protein